MKDENFWSEVLGYGSGDRNAENDFSELDEFYEEEYGSEIIKREKRYKDKIGFSYEENRDDR